MDNEVNMVRMLAPEDIEPGQYVSTLHMLDEGNPFSCVENPSHFELAWDVQPVRVIEVCLPLVLAVQADGTHRTIDVRKYRLGRVPQAFGQQVFACVEGEKKKEG